MDLQPAERRRLRQREEAQRAILGAAQTLLVTEGFDRFSMRRLADACGYTAPTIYYYFRDKQGVIDALLEGRFAELFKRLARATTSRDPVGRLRQLSLAFVHFGLRNPTHFRLLTAPRGAEDEGTRPPSAEKCFALFEAPMRELEAVGRLLVEDLAAAQQAVWSTLYGLISLRTSRPGYEWADDLPAIAVDVMLRGVALPAAPDGREGAAE